MTGVKIRNHKLFAALVAAGIDLPRDVKDRGYREYEEFNKDDVSVASHSLLSSNGVTDLEALFKARHEQTERYNFLNYVGFTVIMLKLDDEMASSEDDDDIDVFKKPGFMSHLIEDHAVPHYMTFPEVWANVWANMANVKMGYNNVIHPSNLTMGDSAWYHSTLSLLSDEVAAGEYTKTLEACKDKIKHLNIDCPAVDGTASAVKEAIHELLMEAVSGAINGGRTRHRNIMNIVMGGIGDDMPQELKDMLSGMNRRSKPDTTIH